MNARTACSGVWYVEMPDSERIFMPSRMLCPPNHAASMGFCVVFESSATACAAAVGLVIAWGVMMIRIASTPGSFRTMSVALAIRLDLASPRTSTGLRFDQNSGRFSERSDRVSPDSPARVPLRAMRASVAITPGPPALVTIPSLDPRGILCRPSSSAQSNMSPISYTRARPTL